MSGPSKSVLVRACAMGDGELLWGMLLPGDRLLPRPWEWPLRGGQSWSCRLVGVWESRWGDKGSLLIVMSVVVVEEACGAIDTLEETETKWVWHMASDCLVSWWHHNMETFSTLLALCEENPPVTGGFPSQRASKADLWCFLLLLVWKLKLLTQQAIYR